MLAGILFLNRHLSRCVYRSPNSENPFCPFGFWFSPDRPTQEEYRISATKRNSLHRPWRKSDPLATINKNQAIRTLRKLLITPSLPFGEESRPALTPPSRGLAIHPSSPWTDLESNKVTTKKKTKTKKNRLISNCKKPILQKPFAWAFPYVPRVRVSSSDQNLNLVSLM